MRHKLIGLLEQSPVIPAVKDETALTRAAGCESRVLFLLGGDLLTRFTAKLYAADTNTNVCPSIHVIGSFAVYFAARDIRRFRAKG